MDQQHARPSFWKTPFGIVAMPDRGGRQRLPVDRPKGPLSCAAAICHLGRLPADARLHAPRPWRPCARREA